MHFHSFRHIRGNQSDSQCSRNINYQNLWQHQIRNYGDGVESCIPLCTPIQSCSGSIWHRFPRCACGLFPRKGISMHRFYSLIPNRFPTKRPTSLIDWMPMRFSSSAATKPSRIMLRTRFEQPIRLLPSHVSREAHVSIPHTAFTMSLPHLERSPKLQLFPLVSTSPTRFPYPHIHICNPRHFS